MSRNIPEIPQKLLNKILSLDQEEIVFLKNMNPRTELTTEIENKLINMHKILILLKLFLLKTF